MTQYSVIDLESDDTDPLRVAATSPENAAELALGANLVRSGANRDLRARVYSQVTGQPMSMVPLSTKLAVTIQPDRRSRVASNTSIALLLEDEPIISMDLEMLLGGAGFDVVTAMSRSEAHEWLDRQSPDIVIVDIELRDGTATDVVERLIKAKVPFIVHSGQHPSQHVGTPFERGIWVNKPCAPDDLMAAARTAMQALDGYPSE